MWETNLGALGFSVPGPAFISWVEDDVEAWTPEAQEKVESPATVSRGSRDGNEEKEGLKKSLKQKEMEREGVSPQEHLISTTPSSPNNKTACPELCWTQLWLQDTPTHRLLCPCQTLATTSATLPS